MEGPLTGKHRWPLNSGSSEYISPLKATITTDPVAVDTTGTDRTTVQDECHDGHRPKATENGVSAAPTVELGEEVLRPTSADNISDRNASLEIKCPSSKANGVPEDQSANPDAGANTAQSIEDSPMGGAAAACSDQGLEGNTLINSSPTIKINGSTATPPKLGNSSTIRKRPREEDHDQGMREPLLRRDRLAKLRGLQAISGRARTRIATCRKPVTSIPKNRQVKRTAHPSYRSQRFLPAVL